MFGIINEFEYTCNDCGQFLCCCPDDDIDIGICQGCGGYGILGTICSRPVIDDDSSMHMEECGEYL